MWIWWKFRYHTELSFQEHNGKIQTKNRNTSYVKRNNNNYGFGQQNFEQVQTRNNNNLSKEEEFLLEDLITEEGVPTSNSRDGDIPDFEAIGNND